MEELKFKYNWCNFFTPCPYREDDTMIGDYECTECCSHFESCEITKEPPINGISSYSRYNIIGEGKVKCRYGKVSD